MACTGRMDVREVAEIIVLQEGGRPVREVVLWLWGVERRLELCSQVWRSQVAWPGTVGFIETTIFAEDASGVAFGWMPVL